MQQDLFHVIPINAMKDKNILRISSKAKYCFEILAAFSLLQ